VIRLHKPALLLASAGMLLLLAGCGQNFNGSGASQPGLGGTPGTAQLVKTGTVSTSVSPQPSQTAPGQLTGKVTLQIVTMPGRASDAVVFTLKNQTSQEILFSDHLSECTVLVLQVQSPANSGLWEAVAPCKLMTPTRLLTLGAGKSLTITLAPPGGQWTPGLYRALLNYAPSGADHTLRAIFSPSFQAGS
jgi:hypothetical protein